MPFGIKNGPAHFQRCMTAMLGNLNNADVYIDDIIVYSTTFEQHLTDLENVFQLLRQHKLRASPEKATLCKQTLNFLGHKIGSGTISPQEAKIDALRNYQRSITKKGICAFLGATGFYQKFICNYSTIATPLFKMTTKLAPEKPEWKQEEVTAFEQLRSALTSESVLVSPDPQKPYIFCTDTSTIGVGGILCQLNSEGNEHPIAYFSKKLKKHQRNYSITKLELLAVVLSIEHFQIYLSGNNFTIYTGHRALLAAEKFKTANGCLARWALFL